MPYLINLIDVDGTQLVFSSELALTHTAALEHIHRFQRKAVTEGWDDARITVKYLTFEWSYGPFDDVSIEDFERSILVQLEPAIEAELAKHNAGPCPAASALPYGYDQLDLPDPAWAEPYDD